MSRFVLFSVISLLAACQTAPPHTWSAPPGVKAARVNGYDIAYVEQGRGTQIIMIHGSLLDYRSFQLQMAPLGEHYRAIALSLRHYYPERWDGSGDGFSHRQHSADVAAFVKALGGSPAYIIGHSRGGFIALHVAKTYPDAVRALVLAEPPVQTILGPADPSAGKRQQRIDSTLQMFERGNIDGGLQHFIDDVAGPGSWNKRTSALRRSVKSFATTRGHSRGISLGRKIHLPARMHSSSACRSCSSGARSVHRCTGESLMCWFRASSDRNASQSRTPPTG